MKRIIAVFCVCIVLSFCVMPAMAADTSREYFFELAVDGKDTKQVQKGDIITVVFTLRRTDSDQDSLMYAMQNEIRYDSKFFQLVEGSALLSSGISTTDIGLRDDYREFYMNFVSLAGGESWTAERLIGSIRLEVIADSGVTKITNQDYLVSTADGKDVYSASCQDVTVIISTDCTVKFESNGGTEVESQSVLYGETVTRPEDPVREGYRLECWCKDIDLQEPWDFEKDTVQGNMTLYAKWVKGGIGTADGGSGISGWIIFLLLLILGIFLLLLLLFGRKTVTFETDCDIQIPDQKVWKGAAVERPVEPKRPGRLFAGWYCDEMRLRRWDFEEDMVEDNMTLYAKWI